MPEDIFGPLLAPWNVEKAVLSTLEEWAPTYAAVVERKNELQNRSIGRPGSPGSYRGGLDWLAVKEDLLPELIVIANPIGEPERHANEYIQAYETQVGAVCVSQETANPEAIVRRNAGLWAAATMGVITHHGALGGFAAQESVLIGAARVELLTDFTENRRFATGISTWHIYAQLIKSDSGPLLAKQVEPEEAYPPFPEAKTHHATLVAEPITEKVH